MDGLGDDAPLDRGEVAWDSMVSFKWLLDILHLFCFTETMSTIEIDNEDIFWIFTYNNATFGILMLFPTIFLAALCCFLNKCVMALRLRFCGRTSYSRIKRRRLTSGGDDGYINILYFDFHGTERSDQIHNAENIDINDEIEIVYDKRCPGLNYRVVRSKRKYGWIAVLILMIMFSAASLALILSFAPDLNPISVLFGILWPLLFGGIVSCCWLILKLNSSKRKKSLLSDGAVTFGTLRDMPSSDNDTF